MRQAVGRTSGGDEVRRIVLALWAHTRLDWGFATTRLAAALRQERGLPSAARRAVAETLYGMIRQARRIDFALESARARVSAGDVRELAQYLTYRLLAGELGVSEARAVLPAVAWEEVAQVDVFIARERDPLRRLALAQSLPDWLAERLRAAFGDDAEAVAVALNTRAALTARANSLKIGRDDLVAALGARDIEVLPTRHAPHGFTFARNADVWSLPEFKQGLFEIQDEGSQLVALLVAPPPRALVLDACAGAGGKTLALGALMHSQGRLLAVDVDERKLSELKKRARRAGLSSVQALATQEDAWPSEVATLAGRFDRVLVDAPCSGTGSLRRNPEIRWRLNQQDLPRLVETERALLRRSVPLVAPGGRLIYATCSLLAEENEAVVEWFCQTEPAFAPMRAAEIWGNTMAAPLCDASGTFLKTNPWRHGMDGFFAAVLRKQS